MRTLIINAALAVSLAGAAACSKKAEDLPPQPVTAKPAEAPPAPVAPAVTNSVVPGSLADMIQEAGSDRVFFDYDSFAIGSDARTVLTAQAAWLGRYPNVRITVEGHADERGTREYNLALGQRRANAVKNFLAGQGVSAGRINTISYGKERPAVEGSNESAYAQNRRAVTVLIGAAS